MWEKNMIKKAVQTLGYATEMIRYICTELVMAMLEDHTMPEIGRVQQPHE
jgi:hypothetical protein